MPKIKTNKAAKKRFKISSKGKVLRPKTSRRHLLTDKSSKDKRELRGWKLVDETDKKRIETLLPYD
ncbi:MAG: 50S ribosomal protein L35 [Candidatus Omnitrophica bacterium]|nr:50S ribosomal protein L35 [Candidatus Omnitrophota bacterium]